MTTIIATIQEGHPAQNLQAELDAGLGQLAAESLGGDGEAVVRWKVIPKGFGWTAGRPSNSSVLLCVVPEDLPFETRVGFMTRINDLWVNQTGADPNELLIFTQDRTL